MKLIFATLAVCILSQGTCEEISWSFPPTPLSTNAFNASNANITTDPNGNVVAIWIENGTLKGRSKKINMSWSSLASISGAGTASSPSIVSDYNGMVTALWLQNGIVQTSSKTLNGNWSAPFTLSSAGATFPVLAIDSLGNLVAAWVQGGAIRTSVKPYLGNWSPKTNISGTNQTNLSVEFGGVASTSNIVLVWQENSASNGPVVYASTRTLSSSWTAKQAISNIGDQVINPHVDVDSNGNATAIWYTYDVLNSTYNNVIVQSASLPFQQQWSAPVQLSQPGICNPAPLVARIAYDGTGNALAMWNLSFDGETFNIETSVKPVVGNWSTPVNLLTSNTYAYDADTSVSVFGDAVTAYMFYNGQSLMTQTTDSNISGFLNNQWSAPVTISSGSENAFPKVTSTVTGNAINAAAVWLQNSGTTNVVVASTGSKSLLLPPQNLSVVQQSNNFGVFTQTYNVLSWQASADPSTTGYLIYRNGMFLEQVDANTLQHIDDNQPQNSVTTYGVRAINAFNTTSPLVTVLAP